MMRSSSTPPTRSSALSTAMWCGVGMSASITSLVQDLVGQEAWIQAIRSAWVSWYVTVPIALAFLLGSSLWYMALQSFARKADRLEQLKRTESEKIAARAARTRVVLNHNTGLAEVVDAEFTEDEE